MNLNNFNELELIQWFSGLYLCYPMGGHYPTVNKAGDHIEILRGEGNPSPLL